MIGIETIEQYQKIKADVLEEVGEGVLSPYAVSCIMDVPMKTIKGPGELYKLEKLKGFNTSINFDYSHMLENTATIKEMEEYGDKLLSIFYVSSKMLYFFIMANNKLFRIRSSSLRHSRLSSPMVRSLLSFFEKYKIEELKDRATWIPIKNRWEILDI